MTKQNSDLSVPFESRIIWDTEAVKAADGLGSGPGPDLRGEIHPDLIRYRGYWYCGLKEAHGPYAKGTPRPRARIIRSADAVHWESVKLLERNACRVSDLKFSITDEGALMVATNIAFPPGDINQVDPLNLQHGPIRRWSVTWLTQDGVDWGAMYACPSGINVLRYEVTWHNGMGYSLSYPNSSSIGTLYRTADGRNWQAVARNVFASWFAAKPEWLGRTDAEVDPHDMHQTGKEPSRLPSESALAFDPKDGTAWAIARVHPVFAILGSAKPPRYDEWTWRPLYVDYDGDGNCVPAYERLGVQMGGPTMRFLSNGVLLAAGRADASTPEEHLGRLTLFRVDRENAVLKRWGDFDGYSHYPGLVEHDRKLWISCGRQQGKDPFEVYLLKAPLPKA